MKHERIFKREDGSRIKICCDNNFYVTIDRCLKGKRTFKRVAPIGFSSDDNETGIHYNGAHLIDIKTNMCIVSNGVLISDYSKPTCAEYSIGLFAHRRRDTRVEDGGLGEHEA